MTKILSVATAAVPPGLLADPVHQQYPRVDYLELQNLLQADTIDYGSYEHTFSGKVFRQLETHLRSDVYLATIGWQRSRGYPVVFAWSERAGIPIAGYRRLHKMDASFVSMFQCWSARQELVMTSLGLFAMMDTIIVHCSSMKRNFMRLGAPEEKVKLVYYSIDQNFFRPQPEIPQQRDLVISLGESRSRDYAALFEAVDGLPARLKVPAFGHWYAREKNNGVRAPVPENVSMVNHLPQSDLRALYASAQFVVLPVHDLVYSAGATATLEAGSMARAVIAFRSQGITDYIVDGETGILVEPGNVAALRDAIQYLLANPQEARRMGENARQRIVESFNLEGYVRQIAELLVC